VQKERIPQRFFAPFFERGWLLEKTGMGSALADLSKLAWPEIRTDEKSASGFRLPWFLRRNPGWLVGNLGYRKIFRKCPAFDFSSLPGRLLPGWIECVVEFINIR